MLPLSFETVKTSFSLPVRIDARALTKCRAARLEKFFTTQSLSAPCVTYSYIIPAMLWKSIDNNNCATERRIGKLKNGIQDRVSDDNKNSRAGVIKDFNSRKILVIV